jgi:hypothetical protein
VESDRDGDERDGADGEVDVEDPTPGEVVDEEAAEERPDHRRDAEHRTEEPLVLAALARGMMSPTTAIGERSSQR